MPVQAPRSVADGLKTLLIPTAATMETAQKESRKKQTKVSRKRMFGHVISIRRILSSIVSSATGSRSTRDAAAHWFEETGSIV
jgi:hypothetical protein